MSIDTEISVSLAQKYAEAVRKCLARNVPLKGLMDDRFTLQYPESVDEFQIAPKIMIWPEPYMIYLRPKPGDWAWPSMTVVIFNVFANKESPLYKLTDPNPMDVMEHEEKLLERGDLDIGGELGKLFDPTLVDPLDPLIPDTQRFLNRERPTFIYRSRRVIYRTRSTAWPLLVTYKTTVKKSERSLI